MGKQLGVLQYGGKLGQTVGMKNGFGGTQAFSREYVATNKSESTAQIERRIRMLPAVNFRRQLADLIARGFQGVKYGGPSSREYMKFALELPLSDTPQLVKNSTVAFPGPYLISKGSLGNITCTIGTNAATTNIFISPKANPSFTIGDLSESLVENGKIKNGDQISIIVASMTSDEQDDPQNIDYNIISFQVNEDSTEELPYNITGGVVNIDYKNNDYLEFTFVSGITVVGMAVINSRQGTTPLRSTSRMGVNKAQWPAVFGSTIKPAVKQSYTKTAAAALSTNWPIDPDIEPEDSGFVTIGVTIYPTGGGTVTGAGTYTKGDAVTLQATAAANYVFTRWTLNDVEVSTNRTLQITATASANYVAEFLPED